MLVMPSYAGENCTCRYEGNDMATSQGRKLARCERILNNTSWKFLGDGCPIS